MISYPKLLRTYPKFLCANEKLMPKFGVGAPKFGVGFCNYIWFFSNQSNETKRKLITTQRLLN